MKCIKLESKIKRSGKMTAVATKKSKANCESEYAKLDQVLVCEPSYMEIKEVINHVQKKYEHQNINKRRAQQQHLDFTKVLEQNGVTVIDLGAKREFPEQVFTRDIGFVIGENIFVSKMASDIRKGEEKVLENLLQNHDLKYNKLHANKIEGGDVIVDGDIVFIGMGNRTCLEATRELQKKLPNHSIIPLAFDPKYLHLDCLFNILSSEVALIYPEAFDQATLESLEKRYQLVEVSSDEQFSLGTNVLSIGNNKVISQPQNTKVNQSIRSLGFEVIEVDFSEIIKSGGSFRCCSMPLKRI